MTSQARNRARRRLITKATAMAAPTRLPARPSAAAPGLPVMATPTAATMAKATVENVPAIARATLTCPTSAPPRRNSRKA